jgi:hypothetical protein
MVVRGRRSSVSGCASYRYHSPSVQHQSKSKVEHKLNGSQLQVEAYAIYLIILGTRTNISYANSSSHEAASTDYEHHYIPLHTYDNHDSL